MELARRCAGCPVDRAACGAELSPAVERGFAFGARGMLCFDCALRRGGSYDENFDDWQREPLIDDLGPKYG